MRSIALIVIAALVWWVFKLPGEFDSNGKALEQVMASNRTLRQELAELKRRYAENIGYLESQAGLAQACDWLFPSCPEAAVQVGRQAIAQGYGGVGAFNFWFVLLIKLAVLASPLGAAIGIARWIWAYRGRPAALATRNAIEALNLAQSKLQTVQARLDASDQVEKDLLLAIKTARGKLATLRQQVDRQEEEVQRLSLREAELRKTMAALRG